MGSEIVIGILIAICLAGIVMAIKMTTVPESRRKGSGGIKPLTNAGPKPQPKNRKVSNIKSVRPTSRRMRRGGTAMNLRHNDYATDLLFLIALDAALGYDEQHYGQYEYMDSVFMYDDFDYSGSEFEDYAEIEAEIEAISMDDPPPPPSDRIFTEEQLPPEATSFEDLSSDDDTTKYSGWGGDDGDSDIGSSDYDDGFDD